MKISLNDKNRHYLEYLPVLLIVVFIFEFLPFSFLTRMYVYIGFCWPFAMTTPDLGEKILARKYRYSFIKFTFLFNNFLCETFQLEKKYLSDPLMRSISPFMFCAVLGIIAGDWFFFASFFGSVLFELNRVVAKKLMTKF